MASPLPPDPYEALGVAKDATSAAIKMAHRKLVLKCHPDKVTDPAEKQAASDKFHKIQSAYEILMDDSRRERYDASVKLAQLRKEAMARQSEVRPRAAEGRTSSYRPEPPRSTFTSRGERVVYEERRPPYAADYFDAQPRSTARKEPEYTERASSRRPEAKEKPRASTKSSKESDKERRKEKSRQAERDVRRDRERKRETHVQEESASESEEQEWRPQRPRPDEVPRRSRDSYYEPTPRPQREAHDGYFDDRARKMASHTADARDYIMSSRGATRPRTEERRPSPVRVASSRDRVQYIRGDDGRPAYMRRHPSERPSKEAKDEKQKDKVKESSRKTSSRTPERRSSAEEIDERRPPRLNTSKSSPANIYTSSEKQRATSLQPDSAAAMPPPPVRRSETMPYNASSRRAENMPPKSSRATEFTNGEPTPATTPDNQVPPQSKFPYARPYADDTEYPTTEGYRTAAQQDRARPEYTRDITGSPPPIREGMKELPREYGPRSREATYDTTPRVREAARDLPTREAGYRSRDNRDPAQASREETYRDYGAARDPRVLQRTASARYTERPPPPMLNTRTTSYKYAPGGVEPLPARPNAAREPPPREPQLFGEINTTRSPYQRSGDQYAGAARPESIRVQSGYPYGYSSRPNGERPQVSRNNSGGVHHHPQPVRA